MCTHLYKHNNEFCNYRETFTKEIPIHPDTGHCVFHSTDIDWKREQKCTSWFTKLVDHLDSQGEVELHELLIVGDLIEEYPFIDKETRKVEFGGASHISAIRHALIRNEITLYDCEFYDDLYIQRVAFNEVVAINACKFHKGIVLEDISCRRDANIEEGCIFSKEFAIVDSNFVEQLSINGNTFQGEFSIDGCSFDFPLHVIGNVFASSDLHVTFSSTFMSGVAFDRNTYSGLLSFDESVLHGACSIVANNGTPWVNLFRVDLHGTFRFEGTAENLLFQTAAEIKIDDIEIHRGGLMIFDYCNMLNISQEFLIQLQELEREAKVSILDTCKLYRFHEAIIYRIEDKTDDLFHDFHQLVARYFAVKYHTPLIVTMQRLDEKQLKVYYASIKAIDGFERMQNDILKSIDSEPLPTGDLEIQRQAALLRIGNLVAQGLLSDEDQKALRSNQNRITINKLDFVIKEFSMPKGATLAISQATIQNMQVNKLIIKELSELRDPIQFELTQSQFDQLKTEILSISDLADIAKSVNEILTNQKDIIKRESSVKEFLLGHGVSVVGSMTGATLFTFLRLAFPI